MAVLRMEHIGLVVDDLSAAKQFFVELGLELDGETKVEGELVDRVNGLEGVKADVVFFRTPDGHAKLELARYRQPAGPAPGQEPPNTPGLRHLLFAVDDIHATLERLEGSGGELVGELTNYEDTYWLCYVRGPGGAIIELAEKVG